MGSNETDRATENHESWETPPTTPAVPHEHADGGLTRARWLVAMAGLAAGLAAFGAGEAVYDLIPAEKGKVNTMGTIIIVPTADTMTVAAVRNGALTFSVLGVCLGGCLGLAGGLARRSTSATLVAGGLGSVLGLAAGAGVSLAVIPYVLKIVPDHIDYELPLSIVMHGSIWGLTGAAAGFAFAVGLGQPRMLIRAIGGRARRRRARNDRLRFDWRRCLPLGQHRSAGFDNMAVPAAGPARGHRRDGGTRHADPAQDRAPTRPRGKQGPRRRLIERVAGHSMICPCGRI